MGISINHYKDPQLTNQDSMKSRRIFFMAPLGLGNEPTPHLPWGLTRSTRVARWRFLHRAMDPQLRGGFPSRVFFAMGNLRVHKALTVDGNQKSGIHSPVEVGSGWQFIPLFYKVLYMPSGSLGFLNHQQYEQFMSHHDPSKHPRISIRTCFSVEHWTFLIFCLNKSATKETTDEFQSPKI